MLPGQNSNNKNFRLPTEQPTRKETYYTQQMAKRRFYLKILCIKLWSTTHSSWQNDITWVVTHIAKCMTNSISSSIYIYQLFTGMDCEAELFLRWVSHEIKQRSMCIRDTNGVGQIHVNWQMALRCKSGLGSHIPPFVYIIMYSFKSLWQIIEW